MSPEILLATRLALHIITVLLIGGFLKGASRFRLGPSVMAALLLASSASLAFQIGRNWSEMVQQNPQPQLVFFVFAVLVPIAWARGNMAKLYDAMVRLNPKRWWWHS